VTITGAGTVTVKSVSSSNSEYNAASDVEQGFNVNKAVQTITLTHYLIEHMEDAPFDISATASSGLPVTFNIVSGPATISGNTITIASAGMVVVSASQAGDSKL